MARSIVYDTPPLVRPILTPLVPLLEHGRYGSGEMLQAWLQYLLVPFGLAEPDPSWLPEDRARLTEAAVAYEAVVRAERPFFDVLGPLYMGIASRWRSQWLGQYFTPWPIAEMLVALNDLPDRWAALQDGTRPAPISVSDPAAGSGVLLLAHAAALTRIAGAEAVATLHVHAVDVDRLCARMTAAQFLVNWAVHEMPLWELEVYHGDSLRLETKACIVHASDRRRFPNTDVPDGPTSTPEQRREA